MRKRPVVFWVAAIALVLSESAKADPLTLTGPTSNQGTYSSAQLQGMANAGDTVTFGGLTGISVWGLLGGATATAVMPNLNGPGTIRNYGAIQTVNPAGGNTNPNYDLRYFVIATNNSGASSVVSLGQIDPNFVGPVGPGNPAPFIAYQNSNGLLTTPQLVIPNAPAGASLSNLTSLQLTSVPGLQAGIGGPSSGVVLAGNVTHPGTYNISGFPGEFPTANVTVCSASKCSPAGMTTYTGIPLATFLDPNSSDLFSQIVVAKATDGYEEVFSLSELLQADGTADLSDLLAFPDNKNGSGFPRTISAGDSSFAHGRWVSSLTELDVISSVPGPMVGSGIPGLVMAAGALLAWRKRKQNQLAA